MRSILPLTLLAAALLVTACGGGGAEASGKPRFAYVTNGTADFWVIAKAGVEAGAQEFDADVEVLMPSEGVTHQKNMIEDCLTKQMDGIAVSPIDPANQMDLINRAAARTLVITHDSDAPGTERLAYIGMDNYAAGRMCGKLVLEALPGGGKVAIFVGRLEQDNARGRRQGVVDEVLGRSHDPARFDPPDAQPASDDGKYVFVGTYTDQFDFARGKANVEDALSRYPDLAACVGLFGYNPPLILEALKGSGKLDAVKVIAFDEDETTLAGIRDGTVVGTIVQDPYGYGKESIRVLAGLHEGRSLDELGLVDGYLDIPARRIGPAEVDAFWTVLKRNMGQD